MDNNFVFDTTKFVLDEVKKEALKTAMEEICADPKKLDLKA